jgi:predicted ThiF/HesA family dinucleotide-utilizing enzyme
MCSRGPSTTDHRFITEANLHIIQTDVTIINFAAKVMVGATVTATTIAAVIATADIELAIAPGIELPASCGLFHAPQWL